MAQGFDYIKRLGSGHFGEVWLVRDIGLDIQRALKLIPPDKVINPTNFFQEAQILKSVEHPNIVRVDEAGTMADGRIYVAMEYLPKGSLEDEAKGAYVHLTRAKSLTIDILRGLEFAHSKNTLHRDIKPANILVDNNRRGKLSDFGLALPKGIDPVSIGMKGYLYTAHMAPEVLTGGNFDVASEIYACGLTLYRLVNGDNYLPPPGSNFVSDVIAGKYPPRSNYREFIPRPIKTVINRAINIDASKRYKSAAAMRHAIEQLDVCINWNENSLPNGKRWSGVIKDKTYEIVRQQETNGFWSVSFKKGSNKHNLRYIHANCLKNVNKGAADSQTKRLLQDVVLGKCK